MHRFTFSFSLYGQGFSETLFRDNAINGFEIPLLENYINKRLSLLCTDAALLSVRSSNVDSTRDVVIYQDPTQLRAGTWAYGGLGTTENPGEKTNAEDTFTAILLRMNNGGNKYRSFPLLGVPDYVFQGNIIVPGERPVLTGRLNGWVSAMAGAGFGMKGQAGVAANGRVVEFPAKTEDNQLVCLGITGGPPTVGSLITLGAVKPFNKLNRTWRVSSVVPAAGALPAYVYLSHSSEFNTYGPVEGGTWKQPTFAVNVLTGYTISRLTPRKTGVPFGTVRGRR